MKHIYTVYSAEGDMTFIMEDTMNDEIDISTECIGWYFGEPDTKSTETFKGNLKAFY